MTRQELLQAREIALFNLLTLWKKVNEGGPSNYSVPVIAAVNVEMHRAACRELNQLDALVLNDDIEEQLLLIAKALSSAFDGSGSAKENVMACVSEILGLIGRQSHE